MKNIVNELAKLKAVDFIPFLIEKTKENTAFRVVMVALSALFIFLGGKSFGEFLYYVTN